MKLKTSFLLVFFSALFASCINQKEPEGADLQVGDKLPEFTIELNDGTQLSYDDFRTGSWLICFFNTSCPDCQRELPKLQELYNSQFTIYNSQITIHNSSNNQFVNIVCIAREQTEESIKRYWTENNLTLPYSAQEDRRIYNLFATRGIPQIYLTKDGIIIKKWDDKDSIVDI